MPFRFFTDRATAEVWLGSYMLFREWANAPFGCTMLWIPGPAHASAAAKSLAWMRAVATSLALGERTIRLSDFEPDVAELCGRIRRSVGEGGFAIWGFPSYIARIAKELLESGAELPSPPRVVFTYAETLSLLNRRAIEEAFRCRTANHYSAWEVLHMAQTCPDYRDLLHVNSERAIVRVVREDGSAAPAGEVGRVVVTDLANYVMPFINYEIGDWAMAGESCPCGRGFPTLVSLEGRLGEVLQRQRGARSCRSRSAGSSTSGPGPILTSGSTRPCRRSPSTCSSEWCPPLASRPTGSTGSGRSSRDSWVPA